MLTARRLLSVAGLAVLLPGCASLDISAPGDHAAGPAPITTSATSYTLNPDGVGLRVEIPIRFRNVTGRTIHIVNCHQILSPSLEKRVNGEWRPYWHGATPLCLSPPIVIRAGATYDRTLQIWGALPSHNAGPQFTGPDVEGTYRIVLHALVFDDAGGAGGPVPLEYRVSNTFELRR